MINVTTALVFWLAGAVAAAAAVFALRKPAAAPPGPTLDDVPGDEIAFLFLDGKLIDATDAARAQVPTEPAETDDLARFAIAFGQRFEGLSRILEPLSDGDRVEIAEMPDDPGSLRLVAEREAGKLRVTLEDPMREARSETMTYYSLAAMRAELFTLRSIAERSPIPTWKRRHDGYVIWANSQYMTLARMVAGDEALVGWPPPDLFESVDQVARAKPDTPLRVSLQMPEEDVVRWFDIIALPGEIETLYFALPIDKLVRAENALTDFVHTLTKTFAHLRVGLAIFDNRRRLVLFNPALVDLTSLPAEHLSGRPTLHAFLDALRDAQRIPEPKDYKSWRMRMAQVEAGAADGTFEETWHLPTGQTFRVSGRPHPDGAVAFLFEDISTEVSIARDYRARLDLSQSAADALDTALAAFAPSGDLVFSNAAYERLWGGGATAAFPGQTLRDAVMIWSEGAESGPETDALVQAVRRGASALPWSSDLTLAGGERVRCDLRQLSGAAVLVSFTPLTGLAASSPARTEPFPAKTALRA